MNNGPFQRPKNMYSIWWATETLTLVQISKVLTVGHCCELTNPPSLPPCWIGFRDDYLLTPPDFFHTR